jgi:hypothetical protein
MHHVQVEPALVGDPAGQEREADPEAGRHDDGIE